MKKVTKFLLMAAVAVGMMACSNDDVPAVDKNTKGEHFLSVQFVLNSPQQTLSAETRAISNDTQPGTTAETNLSAASALVVALQGGAYKASEVFPISSAYGSTPTPGQYIPTETATLEVPAGTYDIVVVTGPAAFVNTVNTEIMADITRLTGTELVSVLTGLTDIASLTTTNAFVMSSRANIVGQTTETVSMTAQDTKAAAVANRASVKLDRLVAKATVKAPTTNIATAGIGFSAIVNGWTLEQGKPAEYTMMQNKTLTNTAKPLGQQDTDWNPNSPGTTINSITPYYTTSLKNFTSWGIDNTAFQEVGITAADPATEGKWLYTTENTNVYVDNTDAGQNYKLGNTTYALIQVKIVPTTLYTDATTTVTTNPNTDGTFYYGLADHKFYTNSAAAADANGANGGANAGAGYYTYKLGMAYYPVWIGQQYDTEAYAPVVRNRAYNLNITSVIALNKPYDPINTRNPKTPYTPGTDNPTPNPVDPTDPIVSDVKYIAAQLEVMNWTAVSKDVILQ